MNCPLCGVENAAGAKFCKSCGASLAAQYKTCKNGHNYDASLDECPYCPKSDVSTTIKSAARTATANQKTVIDKQENINTVPEIEKTIHENKQMTSPPETPSAAPAKNKTVVSSTNVHKNAKETPVSKLTGWLVSFDLDPAGKDFKLFEGRTKVGRTESCNIILNDPGISEEHALIYVKEGKVLLQDELSLNGTFVNGKKVEERVTLKDNDEIKFGNLSFKLKII